MLTLVAPHPLLLEFESKTGFECQSERTTQRGNILAGHLKNCKAAPNLAYSIELL